MSVRAYGTSSTDHPTWQPNTEYTLLDYVVPTVPDGYCYECTVKGISGSIEPTWPEEIGVTVADGDEEQPDHVTWTCRGILAPNPLIVTLDTEGYGGYPLKEVWVRSAREEGKDEFIIYGSHDGVNWRQIDELEAPQNDNKDNRHKGLQNAYRYIKVEVDSEYECEIEIVAGAS